jgi:exonuclease III
MKIGFWNIDKKSFIGDLVDFAYLKSLDIMVLAECTLSSKLLERELSNAHSKKRFRSIKTTNPKFKILTTLDTKFIKNHDRNFGGYSWSINKFELPSITKFSLVSVHMPSKIHWDDTSQSLEAVNLMNSIRDYELKNGSNTILIGDFNMNPYEFGMTSSLGLHGLKDATLAKSQKKREIQGRFYDFFYNPMWNFLGDQKEISGTFFYRKAIHNNVMWNTFDQVLLRPSLLDYFDISGVEISTTIGSKELINKKTRKLKDGLSDHLPILLTLKI